MNKYIKKCLVIYSALALILMGMVGVTYAITATDADQYVTRSQYAVDMAHLQNKLDEKEAGLLGEINRYRSTNIKFTTFDTPTIQYTGTGYGYQGYHRGGNAFPRTMSAGSQWNNGLGFMPNGGSAAEYVQGYYNPIQMWRLWNGNYYISTMITYRGSTDSSTSSDQYCPYVLCAVPVENYPGWYLVMKIYRQWSTQLEWWISLVKLDPNVPMPSNAELINMRDNGVLQIRFKKDLWDWANNYVPKYTTTPTARTYTADELQNNYNAYLSGMWKNLTVTYTRSLTFNSWVDGETGDFMMTIKNMKPSAEAMLNTGYTTALYRIYTGCMMCSLLPKDNVEYMMGPLHYSINEESGLLNTGYVPAYPDPRYIGTGLKYDTAYDIEIVDGVNGIKYWHTYKRPSTDRMSDGARPTIAGAHYSLPIVY